MSECQIAHFSQSGLGNWGGLRGLAYFSYLGGFRQLRRAEFPPESRPSDAVCFWRPIPEGMWVRPLTKVLRHNLGEGLVAR